MYVYACHTLLVFEMYIHLHLDGKGHLDILGSQGLTKKELKTHNQDGFCLKLFKYNRNFDLHLNNYGKENKIF